MNRKKWCNWFRSRKHKKYSKRLKAERIKNKKLVKKYPWLKPYQHFRKRHLDSKYDYSYLNWGFTYGWDIAFGDMFMRELGEAVKEQKGFGILQTKEKYGILCCYTTGTTQEVNDIINKYEHISQHVCVICGKPDVPMLNTGWVSPQCFACFVKNRQRYKPIDIEELWEQYNKLAEKRGEDGWKIPNTYSYTRWDKDNNKEIVTHDVSETVKAVRERYEKRSKKYDKRVLRNKHTT